MMLMHNLGFIQIDRFQVQSSTGVLLTKPDLIIYYENSSSFLDIIGRSEPFRRIGFRCQVSGRISLFYY
jgi:hypothetical protein